VRHSITVAVARYDIQILGTYRKSSEISALAVLADKTCTYVVASLEGTTHNIHIVLWEDQ
jgi:hypothetical protein